MAEPPRRPITPEYGDGVGRAFPKTHEHFAPNRIGGGIADCSLGPVEDDEAALAEQDIVDMEVAVEQMIRFRQSLQIVDCGTLYGIGRRAIVYVGLQHGLHGAQSRYRLAVDGLEKGGHVAQQGGGRKRFLADSGRYRNTAYFGIDQGGVPRDRDAEAGRCR